VAEAKGLPTGFRRIRLFSLYGFEVGLDLSWLLLALLISWSLGAGLFPAEYPGHSRTVYAWMGILVAVGVFFSIVLHEFSHSIVARRYGLPIRGITLFIFGGVAEMEREPPDARAEFFMAIAGPIASFVIAAGLWSLHRIGTSVSLGVPLLGVIETLALINVTVAIFNLLPAFPLDGGRMLRAALWHFRGDYRAATMTSSRIGQALGFVLMMLGVIGFIGGNIIGGMWWFLIGLFVRGAATASYQQVVVNELLRDRPVSDFMRRDPVTVPPELKLADFVEDVVYRHHYKMYPVVDDARLLGSVAVGDLKSIPQNDWEDRSVRSIMQPVSADNAVDPRSIATDLLPRMTRPGARTRYLVVDGGALAGVVTLKDLLELISLKLQLDDAGAR
jgi:Zn-dependent protease/predicted transcriptional regulator